MIVQCEACQTRFRLADEKVKPGGIKVRCSKCKTVFSVTPPEPDAVDFGSFNMEKIPEEAPASAAPEAGDLQADSAEPTEPAQQPSAPPAGADAVDEPDFKASDEPMDDSAGMDRGLDGDFSGAEFSPPSENDENPVAISSDSAFEAADETGLRGDVAETGESDELDFGEDSGPALALAADFSAEEPGDSTEFSFDDDVEDEQREPLGAFDFDGEDEESFSFEAGEEKPSPPAAEAHNEPDEFSFDDETPFAEDAAAEWSDVPVADDTSFDFEEPGFDFEEAPAAGAASDPAEDGLQFGEIDFKSDRGENAAPADTPVEDFSQATIAMQEEPQPSRQKQQSPPPPARGYNDVQPFAATPKKSSLSRILVLLVLLLAILGGAAGLLFMQEGALNLNALVRYLPFLQDYIGEAPPDSPGDRIGINIIGSSYVNGQAGQLLVIQGAAVNNHPAARSAITIKGVLLDAQGKTLLQQTVFCGNKLEEEALQSMPFADIEEAMNNQFGDSLSNMNVAAGASIPFTIVFRNLPADIAKINVEVVDSKPGAA